MLAVARFFSDPGIGLPTEIFLPERHYSGGWELTISGTYRFTVHDQARQLLFLNV